MKGGGGGGGGEVAPDAKNRPEVPQLGRISADGLELRAAPMAACALERRKIRGREGAMVAGE